MSQTFLHAAIKLPRRSEIENRPYVHRPFPSTRFHPDGREAVVQNHDEDLELGEGWATAPFPPIPVVAEPTPEERVAARLTAQDRVIEQLTADNADLSAYCAQHLAELRELKAEVALLDAQLTGAKSHAAREANDKKSAKAKAE